MVFVCVVPAAQLAREALSVRVCVRVCVCACVYYQQPSWQGKPCPSAETCDAHDRITPEW
jgi:hypothetical protein